MNLIIDDKIIPIADHPRNNLYKVTDSITGKIYHIFAPDIISSEALAVIHYDIIFCKSELVKQLKA